MASGGQRCVDLETGQASGKRSLGRWSKAPFDEVRGLRDGERREDEVEVAPAQNLDAAGVLRLRLPGGDLIRLEAQAVEPDVVGLALGYRVQQSLDLSVGPLREASPNNQFDAVVRTHWAGSLDKRPRARYRYLLGAPELRQSIGR